jgi:hypothetical protein
MGIRSISHLARKLLIANRRPQRAAQTGLFSGAVATADCDRPQDNAHSANGLPRDLSFGRGIPMVLCLATLASFAGATVATSQTLFQQPAISLQNFQVAHGPQPGVFTIVQWQPNPFTADHNDVPVTWAMNQTTGLAVPAPLSASQAGTANRIGSTGVQIYNNTVGINLNSLDFSPTGTNGNLVGIMPAYTFPDTSVRPFQQPGSTLVFSMEMQVPYAVATPPANNPSYKGQAYVGMDMLFQDMSHPTSPQISVTVGTFAMHRAPPENIGFTTQGGGRILIKTSLGATGFSTPIPGSQGYQSQTWTGFRSFAAGVTTANFSNGIQAIRNNTVLLSSLGLTADSYSTNVADYALVAFHLNPELNYAGGSSSYTGGSVQMGLSVRNFRVALQ